MPQTPAAAAVPCGRSGCSAGSTVGYYRTITVGRQCVTGEGEVCPELSRAEAETMLTARARAFDELACRSESAANAAAANDTSMLSHVPQVLRR